MECCSKCGLIVFSGNGCEGGRWAGDETWHDSQAVDGQIGVVFDSVSSHSCADSAENSTSSWSMSFFYKYFISTKLLTNVFV